MRSVGRKAWLGVALALGGAAAAAVLLRPGPPRASVPGTPALRTPELRQRVSDGHRTIGLAADDSLVGLDECSPEVRSLVARALVSGRLETPDFSGLGGRPLSDASVGPDSRAFALSEPLGSVVESDTPRFRWQAVPGASRYEVAVFDEDLKPLVTSPALTTPEWTPDTPLARGRIYVWQVTAQVRRTRIVAPRPPALDARFEVLGEEGVAALAKARREGGSQLVLAAVLARYGLLEAAGRELTALRSANPDSLRLRELGTSLMPTDLE
jgi:hypothetical protein